MAVDLTDEVCNECISERHLVEIAKAHCTRWTLLPPLLGLDSTVQSDIEKCRKEPVEKRLSFLREWKQRQGCEATYKALISALQDIDCRSDAEFVFNLIKQMGMTHRTAHTQTEASEDQSETSSTAAASERDEPSTPSEKVQMDLKHQLRRNLKKIGRQYASYVDCICTSLRNIHVPPENLATFLLKLPALQVDTGKECHKLLAELKNDLRNAKTINEIIDLVHEKHASFLNYDVFQDIVENYKLWSIDNAEVLKYPEYLKTYIEKHTVSEFLQINPELAKVSKDSDEVVLKFEIDISIYKLGSILELKSIIAEMLEINPSCLRLLRIEEGCVVVTFLIPSPVAQFAFQSQVFTTKQMDRLYEASIIWLKYTDIDGVKKSVNTRPNRKQQSDVVKKPLTKLETVETAFDQEDVALAKILEIDFSSQKIKSAVLLGELKYLKENIGNIARYIPVFSVKKILTKAQCLLIKEQKSFECQMQKFVELISLDERSFTIFCQALKDQRVHSHVANYLKRKVAEMEKITGQGRNMLSAEQQRVFLLLEFCSQTSVTDHDLAREILSVVNWDLPQAVVAAKSGVFFTPECSSEVTSHREQEIKVQPIVAGPIPFFPLHLPSQDTEHLSSSKIWSLKIETSTCALNRSMGGVRKHGTLPNQASVSSYLFASRHQSAKFSPQLLHHQDVPMKPSSSSSIDSGYSSVRDVKDEFGPLPAPLFPSVHLKTPNEIISPSLLPSHERGPLTHTPFKKTLSTPGEKRRGDPKTPLANVSLSLHHSHEKGTPEHALKRKPGGTVVQNVYVDPPQLSPPEEQQPRKLNSPLRHSPLSNSQPAVGNPRTVNLPLKKKSLSDLLSASPGTQTSSDATPYIMAISDDKAKEMMRTVGKPGVFFIRPSPARKDTPHTLCLTTGRNYLKYHIVLDHLGFHIDTESSFDSLSKLVEHYKKHPVKHSSDDKNSSDTKLTTPLSEYEPGDAMKTFSRLGSDRQLHQTQQPGGSSKQGVQTPNTLSTKMLTVDSDLTRQHPVAGGASKQEGFEVPPSDLPIEDTRLHKKSTPVSPHFPSIPPHPNRPKRSSSHPSMLKLQMMEDAEGCEIRIIDEIAPRWDQVAIALEVDPLYINILNRDYPQNSQQACYKMLLHWTESQASQVSWGFLVDALRRADYKVLAGKIEKVQEIQIKSV